MDEFSEVSLSRAFLGSSPKSWCSSLNHHISLICTLVCTLAVGALLAITHRPLLGVEPENLLVANGMALYSKLSAPRAPNFYGRPFIPHNPSSHGTLISRCKYGPVVVEARSLQKQPHFIPSGQRAFEPVNDKRAKRRVSAVSQAKAESAVARVAAIDGDAPMLAPGLQKVENRSVSTGKSICVVGEALMDMLPVKSEDGFDAWRHVPGGSPYNVCIAAKRLGADTFFMGGLSTDMFGTQLYDSLHREEVSLDMVVRVPNPSTLAFVSKSSTGEAQYGFFKEMSADRQLTAEGVVAALQAQPPFAAVHMSLGAVTLEDSKMAKTFVSLCREAQIQGAFTSFDPNIRSVMIEGSPALYRAMVEELVRFVDVAKASSEDIDFLYGADAPLNKVAQTWLDLGARLVIFTRGAKGLTAYFPLSTGTMVSLIVTPPITPPLTIDATGSSAPVQDTVGAGDTVMGAILNGLVESGLAPQLSQGVDWDGPAVALLKDILARAAAAASINCARSGADPPTFRELDEALSVCIGTEICEI